MPARFCSNRSHNKGFVDATSRTGKGLNREIVGRGAAFADYDNDGDIDIFIVNHGEQGILLQNQQENRNNWIGIPLEGTERNR